jgi:hypothetical protein
MFTLLAASGPLFVTVIEYVSVDPLNTTLGALFAISTSAVAGEIFVTKPVAT